LKKEQIFTKKIKKISPEVVQRNKTKGGANGVLKIVVETEFQDHRS
jgi:hypothetical protein